MDISTFNGLPIDQQKAQLVACCRCDGWAETVLEGAPFDSGEQLMTSADTVWQTADEDWILEAFSGHPQIGDLSALRSKYAATASAEQGQVTEASETTLVSLRDQNQEYLDRFGFIFIVCATGKSAEEMLTLLNARINNSRETELQNGAAEQGKITRLRLTKLFDSNTTGL